MTSLEFIKCRFLNWSFLRQFNFLFFVILGVGLVLRKMGNSVSPTVYLEKNGDEFSFHTVSTFKSTVIKFKLGQEFEEETLDGRKVKSVCTLDGSTLKQTQNTEKTSTLVREFGETECVVTCVYGDVTCKRWYKLVA